VTEKALIDAIVKRARGLGWKVARFPKVPVKYPGQPLRWMTPVAADGKGWPDLLLVRERIVAAEIKAAETGGKVVQPEQEDWLRAFRQAGAVARIWTPKDWREGHVDQELSSRVAWPEPTPGDPYRWESGT
jgi:hypothetical protein